MLIYCLSNACKIKVWTLVIQLCINEGYIHTRDLPKRRLTIIFPIYKSQTVAIQYTNWCYNKRLRENNHSTIIVSLIFVNRIIHLKKMFVFLTVFVIILIILLSIILMLSRAFSDNTIFRKNLLMYLQSHITKLNSQLHQ